MFTLPGPPVDLRPNFCDKCFMEQRQIKTSAEQIHAAANTLHESAQIVEFATDSVKKSAQAVESNVAEGIQPDLRDLRLYVADLNEKNNIRMRRMTFALWTLAALNVVALAVALSA